MIKALFLSVIVASIITCIVNFSFKSLFKRKSSAVSNNEFYIISYRSGGLLVPILLMSVSVFVTLQLIQTSYLETVTSVAYLYLIPFAIVIYTVGVALPIVGLYQTYFNSIRVEQFAIYKIGLLQTKKIMRSQISKVEKMNKYASKANLNKSLTDSSTVYIFYEKDKELFRTKKTMSHVDFFVNDLKEQGVKVTDVLTK